MPDTDTTGAEYPRGLVTPSESEALRAAVRANSRGASNLVQMHAHSLWDKINSKLGWAVGEVGLSGAGGGKINKARVRNNWDAMSLQDLFQVCRTTSKTNWFTTWAVRLKVVFSGAGFRFEDKEARAWTHRRTGDEVARAFKWAAMVSDVWQELMVQDNAVVFWRRRDADGPGAGLPFLNVLPCEGVHYSAVNGEEVLKVYLKRQSMPGATRDAMRERLGARYYDAVTSGKPLVIKGWEDEEFEFRAFTRGKRGDGLVTPSMVSILDDLEYLELIRVGDYNGALKRKDVIRQTKKGYPITVGAMAGQNVHHLKRKQKDAIAKVMQEISGAADLTTNFDIGIEFPHLAADFFDDVTTRGAMRRLMNWGGFATLLLQEGLSRIHGVSPYLMNVLRAEMLDVREKAADFLQDIFESESFLGDLVTEAPPLRPIWANGILYSSEELKGLVAGLVTNGLASPPTIRERYLDLDEERESELMLRAHEDRRRYTPPFESRQGLLEKVFTELQTDNGGGPRREDGGDGGAPEE